MTSLRLLGFAALLPGTQVFASLDVNQNVLAQSYANQFSTEGNDVQAKGMIAEALPAGTSDDDIYDWYVTAGLELLGHADPAAEKLFHAAAEASHRPLSHCPEASYGAAYMAQRRGDKAEATRLLNALSAGGANLSTPQFKPYALLYEVAEKHLTELPHDEADYGSFYRYAAGTALENAIAETQSRFASDHDSAALEKSVERWMPVMKKWWDTSNANRMDAARVAYDGFAAFCKTSNLPPPPDLDATPSPQSEASKAEEPALAVEEKKSGEDDSNYKPENLEYTVAPGNFGARTQALAAESAAALIRGDTATAQKFGGWLESSQLHSQARSGLCVLRGLYLARVEAWALARADFASALKIETNYLPALAALAYIEARTASPGNLGRPAYRVALRAAGKPAGVEEDSDCFDKWSPGMSLLAAAAIVNGTAKLSGDDMRRYVERELSPPSDGCADELEYALLTAYSASIDRGERHLFGRKDLDSILRFSQDLLQRSQNLPEAKDARKLATELFDSFSNQKDFSTWVAYARAPSPDTKAAAETAWKSLHARDPLWPGKSLPLPVENLPDEGVYRKLKDLLAGPASVANDEAIRNFEDVWWQAWTALADEPFADPSLKAKAGHLFRVQALLQYLQYEALPRSDRNLSATNLRFNRFLTLAACCDESLPHVYDRALARGFDDIRSEWVFNPDRSKLFPWLKFSPLRTARENETCQDLLALTAAADSFAPLSSFERSCLSEKILNLLPGLRLRESDALLVLSKYLSSLITDADRHASNLQALRDWSRDTMGVYPEAMDPVLRSTPLGEFCATFDASLAERINSTTQPPKPPADLANAPSVLLRLQLTKFLASTEAAASSFATIPTEVAKGGSTTVVFSEPTLLRWQEYGVSLKLAEFRRGTKSAQDLKSITEWLGQLEAAGRNSPSATRREAVASLVKRARMEILIQNGAWTKLATAPR